VFVTAALGGKSGGSGPTRGSSVFLTATNYRAVQKTGGFSADLESAMGSWS
jgi:hypothetical protein